MSRKKKYGLMSSCIVASLIVIGIMWYGGCSLPKKIDNVGLKNEANIKVDKPNTTASIIVPVVKDSPKANVKTTETVDSNRSGFFRDIRFSGTLPMFIITMTSIGCSTLIACRAMKRGSEMKRSISNTSSLNIPSSSRRKNVSF